MGRRGIRIVGEMDLPMHSSDLAPLKQRGMEFCDQAVPVELYNNPANNRTQMLLRALLEEMTGLFPDGVFHIGTDEIIERNKTGHNNTGHCTIAQIADLEQFL